MNIQNTLGKRITDPINRDFWWFASSKAINHEGKEG
jgi:hypothetical protein